MVVLEQKAFATSDAYAGIYSLIVQSDSTRKYNKNLNENSLYKVDGDQKGLR